MKSRWEFVMVGSDSVVGLSIDNNREDCCISSRSQEDQKI